MLKIFFESRIRHPITYVNFDDLLKKLKQVVNPKVDNALYCELPVLAEVQDKLLEAFPSVKFRFANNTVIDVLKQDDQTEIAVAEHNRAHLNALENVQQILENYYFPELKQKVKERSSG